MLLAIFRNSTFLIQAAIVAMAYFLLLIVGIVFQKDFLIAVAFNRDGFTIHFVGVIILLIVSNIVYLLYSKLKA